MSNDKRLSLLCGLIVPLEQTEAAKRSTRDYRNASFVNQVVPQVAENEIVRSVDTKQSKCQGTKASITQYRKELSRNEAQVVMGGHQRKVGWSLQMIRLKSPTYQDDILDDGAGKRVISICPGRGKPPDGPWHIWS